MAFTDEDKQFLSLVVENATLKAFDAHREKDHTPLEARIDRVAGSVSRKIWKATGAVVASVATLEGIKAMFHGSK